MDTTTEVLILAKEILEGEVEWCQRTLYQYETDEHGNIADDPKFVSACALGAIQIALSRLMPNRDYSYGERREIGFDAEERLMKHIGYSSVPAFNDAESTSKEDVLLVFKKAIES